LNRTSLKSILFVVVAFSLLGALLVGCPANGAAPTPTPAAAATPAAPANAAQGQAAFQQHCNPCHPNGGAGVGPTLIGSPLTASEIRTQVRQGRGQMPAFDAQTIPDAELDALVQYTEGL
jgi:mono/diheme cytochrome c family protein